MPGRHERFDDLYRAEVTALLAYAARRVAAPGDAADVVADVFTVAWRRLDEIPPDGAARLWLYGVARKTLANHRRGGRRRDRTRDRLRGELRVSAGQVRPVSPEAIAIRAALNDLDPDDRELLLLTAWEGLTPTEIAAVLGIPPGTVRRRLHDARRRVRSLLTASIPGGGRLPAGTPRKDDR